MKWLNFVKYKSILKISFSSSLLIIILISIINKNNPHLDYENINFAIIRRTDCITCGLFSYYITYLGCINHFINNGYVPIVDLKSFKNVINGYIIDSSKTNPWELYFNQPFGYTLDNVLKKGKKIKFFECKTTIFRPIQEILFNKTVLTFWHNIGLFYSPIKWEIIRDANRIKKKLFKDSSNILGILMRGTDYLARKPGNHPIPPSPSTVINQVKEYDKKNNYDYFFLATEDDLIRKLFIEQFSNKLKFIKTNKNLDYDYSKKLLLGYNKNIIGNSKFVKNYILNIIILSKCTDIICAITSGTLGVFIFNTKFRFEKIYNIGLYK